MLPILSLHRPLDILENVMLYLIREVLAYRRSLASGVISTLVLILIVCGIAPYPRVVSAAPAGVTEVDAPKPLEISGVATIPGGGTRGPETRFLVVGDGEPRFGVLWPGGSQEEFRLSIPDLESVAYGRDGKGHELVLALSEDNRTVYGSEGGQFVLPESWQEVCGRGAEGLALRHDSKDWKVAVLFEGGPLSSGCAEEVVPTKIAIIDWKAGVGATSVRREVEVMLGSPSPNQWFRVTDLVWNGSGWIVLAGSVGPRAKSPYLHTWLIEVRADGSQGETLFKLEDAWPSYWRKNWEAMDWVEPGTSLVLGHDSKAAGKLAIFDLPYRYIGILDQPISRSELLGKQNSNQ